MWKYPLVSTFLGPAPKLGVTYSSVSKEMLCVSHSCDDGSQRCLHTHGTIVFRPAALKQGSLGRRGTAGTAQTHTPSDTPCSTCSSCGASAGLSLTKRREREASKHGLLTLSTGFLFGGCARTLSHRHRGVSVSHSPAAEGEGSCSV